MSSFASVRSSHLAMHVDTDEANAFAGTENPTGTLLKLFGGKSEGTTKMGR